MEPLLLCVHMEPGKLLRLSMLAMSLGIRVKEVKQDQEGQTLAALCGLEPMKKRLPDAPVGDEMMVMAFFPDALLDRLFLTMRQSGLAMPALRAVLTPTNRNWNCGRLYKELSRERLALNARKE